MKLHVNVKKACTLALQEADNTPHTALLTLGFAPKVHNLISPKAQGVKVCLCSPVPYFLIED